MYTSYSVSQLLQFHLCCRFVCLTACVLRFLRCGCQDPHHQLSKQISVQFCLSTLMYVVCTTYTCPNTNMMLGKGWCNILINICFRLLQCCWGWKNPKVEPLHQCHIFSEMCFCPKAVLKFIKLWVISALLSFLCDNSGCAYHHCGDSQYHW